MLCPWHIVPSALPHPAYLTLDVGNRDVLYRVMEYVEGDSLVALVKRAAKLGTTIPVGVTVHVMIEALTGLHAAHELKGTDGLDPDDLVRQHGPESLQDILANRTRALIDVALDRDFFAGRDVGRLVPLGMNTQSLWW